MKEKRNWWLTGSSCLTMAEMLPWEDTLCYLFGQFQDTWLISLPSVLAELRPVSFLNWYIPIYQIIIITDQIRSDQSLSHVRLFATPWIAARQASLSITNSRSSLRLTSIESVMPSSHLISVVPFSSCPQSLPASESFPVSQLFAWGGQRTGVSV